MIETITTEEVRENAADINKYIELSRQSIDMLVKMLQVVAIENADTTAGVLADSVVGGLRGVSSALHLADGCSVTVIAGLDGKDGE